MRELITKLAVLDGDAATALRVISHFDALVDGHASAAAIIRAAAGLADCPAGFHDVARGVRQRIDHRGRPLPTDAAPGSRISERFEQMTVWLEREGEPGPLDHLILERCARAIHAGVHPGDPAVAAIRLACDPDSRPTDRAAALRLLGLTGAFDVVATTDAAPPAPVIDGHRIQLLRPGALPGSGAAGLARSTGDDAPLARLRAATALRLAVDPVTGGPVHVRHEELGSLAALAEAFDPARAAAVPDVARLEALRRQRPWATGVLHFAVTHTSLREAARLQNLHHSTLTGRLAWLEQRLGYAVHGPHGHPRATVTLALWRIAAAGKAL